MNSSVPKPPQRIRVEMPAEIVPQPVPEAVLESTADTVASTLVSNTIHVSHPGASSPIVSIPSFAEKAIDSAEPEAEILVSDTVLTDEMPVEDTDTTEPADTPQQNGIVNVPADDVLFKRQYYTISEVANMFGANQSQIRFWENEFDILQPKKNKKGDRYFRPEDIKNLVLIHYLLKGRRFTIEGAKEYLKRHTAKAANTHQAIQALEKVKGFLLEMKANLAE